MNRAKFYLRQIRQVKIQIMELEDKAEELRTSLSLSAICYDKDRVQTTPEDRLAKVFSKLLEVEAKINGHKEYINTIHKQMLSVGGDYSKVLEIVYYEGYPLIEVARRLNRSYDYIKHLHLDALKVFEDKYGHLIA